MRGFSVYTSRPWPCGVSMAINRRVIGNRGVQFVVVRDIRCISANVLTETYDIGLCLLEYEEEPSCRRDHRMNFR